MPVFFNGRLIISPASVSRVDDSAMFNANPGFGNIVAILGNAAGGKPKTALRFGSPQQARDVLLSGDALKAIEKAFDPSPEVGGAAEVVFIRVDPATQAELDLSDGSGTVIELVSTGYGAKQNAVKVKIEAGTLSGKKITTAMGNGYYSEDNIARRAFSVTYTGGNATATVAVSPTAVTLVAASTVTIPLADFPTIGEVVERINAVAGFSAAVLDGNSEKPSLNGLDTLSATTVKSVTVNTTANLQAIVDWFNGLAEGFVTATRASGAGTLPSNIGYTYLTGGSDGSASNTDWQDAFDVLQTVDVQWVAPISESSAIWAMADAHVAYMSNVGKRERRAFVGGALGLTDSDALTNAKALNSDRTAYVHLGFYDFDSAGALKLYSPAVAAGMVAGAFAGVNPGTPLTNKSLKVRGLERDLRNPTDTDQLLKGGVFTFENTPTGYKVVQSISSWLVNGNFNRREISTGVALDYAVRAVREAVDQVRGAKGSPQSLSQAISLADTTLRTLSVPEPAGPGILVGDAQNPAFKGLEATLDGDAIRLQFQCSPGIPVNYVLTTVYAQPWSGSASA